MPIKSIYDEKIWQSALLLFVQILIVIGCLSWSSGITLAKLGNA